MPRKARWCLWIAFAVVVVVIGLGALAFLVSYSVYEYITAIIQASAA
jgi:hypothetical protein